MSENRVYPDWDPEAQGTLHAQLQMLDPSQEGVTMNKLRVFYPKMGWNDIMKGLENLKEAGRVTNKLRTPTGSKVAFEYWTWQGGAP